MDPKYTADITLTQNDIKRLGKMLQGDQKKGYIFTAIALVWILYAAFFQLSFLDKTAVALGVAFIEMLPILWMKAGAVGKCPTVDGTSIPSMLILPENKFAVLINENAFAAFEEKLAQHPEIEVLYLVTDYESSFVAMTQALEGKKTYQLYRDYLDNFRINAGRNSR